MNMQSYSEYRVLQTPAGYYVGREYYEAEGGYWGPFSRDSAYFATYAGAQRVMLSMAGMEQCETDAEEEAFDVYHKYPEKQGLHELQVAAALMAIHDDPGELTEYQAEFLEGEQEWDDTFDNRRLREDNGHF
jgi:hypothetical protein